MTRTESGSVLQFVRRILVARHLEAAPDQELLHRFVSGREEAAFAALLRRHGPMVLEVCRAVLANPSDVEDAFQATFLVLARRAGSVRQRRSVGSWLHGVARRTALKARAEATRRQGHEARAPARQEPGPDSWAEAQRIIHEELDALSDRHRAPLVLCYLQGKTQDAAASLLGLSKGTLKRRLERGRALLRGRLLRRGFGPAGVLLAAAWPGAAAGVPPAWVPGMARAAADVAAGRAVTAVVSPAVAALTEGVLKTMTRSKLHTAAGVVLAVLLVAAGVSAVPFGAPSSPPARAERPAPRGALAGASQPKAPAKSITVQTDAIVRNLAWSADGKTLATVGLNLEVVEFKDDAGNDTDEGGVLPNMTVKLWDATTRKLKRSLGEERHTNIMALAFSPDGKTAALTTLRFLAKRPEDIRVHPKPQVRLVDARTWAPLHTLEQEGGVSALAFSPDGTRLALGGGSKKTGAYVKLWDVRDKKPLGGTEGGGSGVSCLAFSRDGKLLACGDTRGKVRLLDGLTGEARREFEGHTQAVCGVGFSPDGKALVSGSTDRAIKVWDVESGNLLRTLGERKAPLSALAFSRDGRHFATAAKLEGRVEILVWDAKTWEVVRSLPGQTVEVQALAFSPDGSTLAIGAGNGIRLDNQRGRVESPGEYKLWRLK